MLSASGVQLLAAGLLTQAYGLYVVAWQAEFDWEPAIPALAFSLQQIGAGLSGPLQAMSLRRWGTQGAVVLGALLLGGGMVGLAWMGSAALLYVTFLAIGLGMSLLGPMTLAMVVFERFPGRQTLATALVQAGRGPGALLVPVVGWAIAQHGWRSTALFSGLAVGFGGLLYAGALRVGPTRERAASPTSDEGVARTPMWRLLRDPRFWWLAGGHAMAASVVSTMTIYAYAYLVDQRAMSSVHAVWVVSTIAVSMSLGQLAGGLLGDRFPRGPIAAVAVAGHAVGIGVLLLDGSLLATLTFAVLHGLAWGVRDPLMQLLKADVFGWQIYPAVEGYARVLVMAGMVVGPMMMAHLLAVTGAYTWGLSLMVVMSATACVLLSAAARWAARAAASSARAA